MRGLAPLREDLVAFLVRPHELMPNLAIFLADTELWMQDKVVGLFDALAGQQGSTRAGPRRAPAVTRLLHETFVVDGPVFRDNTRPNLVQALGTCLRAPFGRR